MFLLGLISLITAFAESCPSLFFILVESALCLCMLLEIITRFIALYHHYEFWRSWWNIFDIIIVLFCLITLVLLSTGGCSQGSNSEELFNTVLLVIRNAAQIFRLVATVRKNSRQMDARAMNVDLDNGSSFLDLINDMDNLMAEPEPEYHIHRGTQHNNNDGGSDGFEFRLSIDSFPDDGSGPEQQQHHPSSSSPQTPNPYGPLADVHRSNSRSSATSIQSASDRLTGRKKPTL
ncbi:hypothetical protein IWW50_000123 [Coemansia erecta]|nr:hypothetical protein GGF43_000405 [Coemansia sp. RSA 2618]KAJ2830677.1 hypothetical protein IWW50_000123 [Coemansia erecta]